jgi:hypothetical protein
MLPIHHYISHDHHDTYFTARTLRVILYHLHDFTLRVGGPGGDNNVRPPGLFSRMGLTLSTIGLREAYLFHREGGRAGALLGPAPKTDWGVFKQHDA